MYQFKLPDIGEGVVEAELTQWRVKEGQTVAENEVLAELLTDKATIEIPSPRAGRVAKLCCKEGEVVKVGGVLIEIEEAADAGGTGGAGSATHSVVKAERPLAAASTGTPANPAVGTLPRPRAHALPMRVAPVVATGGIQAVPAVREYARSQGVELTGLTGSGPDGRIMRRDVDAWLARHGTSGTPESKAAVAQVETAAAVAPLGDPPDWKRVPLRGLRRTIAERMVRSKFTAPHYTYIEELDLTELERRRGEWQAQIGMELSPLVFVARAVVRVLPDYPELNAAMDETRGEVILKGAIHLGIATAVDEGLLVPVVRDAGAKSTLELAEAIRSLAQRARQGELPPGDLKGSTFTISSMGKLGGVAATPILNPPEVAILAVNQIRTLPRYMPAAEASGSLEVQPRQIVNLSMSLDHRVVDGLTCARFVAALKKILEAADFADISNAAPEADKHTKRRKPS